MELAIGAPAAASRSPEARTPSRRSSTSPIASEATRCQSRSVTRPCVSTRTVPPNGRLGGQRRLAADSNRWIVMSLRWDRERRLAGPARSRLHMPRTGLPVLCANVQPRVWTSAVSSPPASPVLTTLSGSRRSVAVSTSALGQCPAPRGMTKGSRGLSATLPSRIWIFSSPSRARNSSVSGACAR